MTTAPLPAGLIDEVVAFRRDIHAHPELGFEESRTAGIVSARLRDLGYEVHDGIAMTGVVGVLHGSQPGKTVMLRADMDALPLAEETERPFASTSEGKMHACGHDGHVAMLLGAARLIAERRAELAGTIVLCFQPAEEGKGGAKLMVEEGMLERFGVERAYGLHLFSQLATGVLGFREGPFYASSDSIEIRIDGFGGHGAAPHLSIDPILVAAEFVASGPKDREPTDRSDRTGRRHDRRHSRRHHAQRHSVERDDARHGARVRPRRAREDGRAHRTRARGRL